MKSDDPRGRSDFDILLDEIARNKGWLAAVYLSSGGGNIQTGTRLAYLIRMFWLKTVSADGPVMTYRPDFVGVSDSAVPELSGQIPVPGKGHCASACTFLHVAGIDRVGKSYVHRGRIGNAQRQVDTERPMARVVEQLQHTEERVVSLYRYLDAGDEVIRLHQATSTLTTAPASLPRAPRYIADFLRAKCKVDLNSDQSKHTSQADQCVAASHEKERLAQFAKLCPNGCRPSILLTDINQRIKALVPAPPSPTVAATNRR
jgi:hypothetical protein